MNNQIKKICQVTLKFQQLRHFAVNITSHDRQVDVEWNQALPFEAIPGPKPLPGIGNSWRFFPVIGSYHGKNVLELHKQLRKEFGNLVVMKGISGRPPFVITYAREDVEKIFRNEGIRPHRNGIHTLYYYQKVVRKDIFKNHASLATLQGDEWSQMRSKVNNTLMKPLVVAKYINRIETVSRDFITKIDFLLQNNTNSELPADFLNEIYRWSLETAGDIALDTRFGCLNLDASKNSEVQNIIHAVNDMFDLIYELDILPSVWRHISTPKYKKFIRTMDYLTSVCRKYTDRAQLKLLDQKSDSERVPSVLEELLKIDKVIAVIMAVDMMIAGVDTTGKTAAAVMYFMAVNQKEQDKLREELINLIPDPHEPLTRAVLNKMLYLRSCIKEAQRIAPVTPGQNRLIPKDITLSGYQIPKNTEIFTGNMLMCNSDDYYQNSAKFMPERWLRESSPEFNDQQNRAFVYLPFGHGPRACVGKKFAFCELEVLLATIFRKYKFEWYHEEMKFNSRLFYGVNSPLKFKLTPLY